MIESRTVKTVYLETEKKGGLHADYKSRKEVF